MATIKEIENLQLNNSQDLCKLAELIGYKNGVCQQLQNKNGSFVSSLLDFFDDNPGAMEAVTEGVMEHHKFDEEDCCDNCGCSFDECECEDNEYCEACHNTIDTCECD